MVLDGHIHVQSTQAQKAPFLAKLSQAGVDGGVVLSAPPSNFQAQCEPYVQRLDHVVDLCRGEEHLYPFFFLNPVEETALEQVDRAVAAGIAGFKIICTSFYPSDPRCVETYRHIAAYGKPVLFHSGILWNGLQASGNYNKPTEFEVLLTIPGLRFALAHISWPWCDECVAVYGKFDHATRHLGHTGQGTEMFLDSTPGTPKIYREDALKKVLFSGYQAVGNLYFGTDNAVEDYDVAWAKDWMATDREIYQGFGLSPAEVQGIFADNLLRFVEG